MPEQAASSSTANALPPPVIPQQNMSPKKKATGADLRIERKKLAAESECLARTHAQRLDGLRAEIDATRREIAAEEQTHAETVAFLERRNAELNATVLEWEERHRDDKERKTKELSEVRRRSRS